MSPFWAPAENFEKSYFQLKIFCIEVIFLMKKKSILERVDEKIYIASQKKFI